MARGPGPPFRPPRDLPERGSGLLGVGEGGDAGLGQAGRRRPVGHEDREDGLGRQVRGRSGNLAGGVLSAGEERRDEHRDDRVDLLGRAEQAQRPAVLFGAGAGDHIDRIAGGGLGWQVGAQRRLDVVGQFRHQQPGCLAGVGDQDAGAAAVGEHRDPPSRGYRLSGQHRGDIEHVFQGAGPDHSGLVEQRLDRHLAGRHRGGVRGCRPAPGTGAAGLHHHDGLVPGDAPGGPGEPAGVGHRFQVGQDEVGAGVVVPVEQQVVGRQVGGVADRHEAGLGCGGPCLGRVHELAGARAVGVTGPSSTSASDASWKARADARRPRRRATPRTRRVRPCTTAIGRFRIRAPCPRPAPSGPGCGPCAPPLPHRTDCCRPIRRREGVKSRLRVDVNQALFTYARLSCGHSRP